MFGICKIVPPSEWKPLCALNLSSNIEFETKLQQIDTLQEGAPFADGQTYTFTTFQAAADAFYHSWIKKHYRGTEPSTQDLIRAYWKVVETRSETVAVEYANDLDTMVVGSGFPRNETQSDRSAQMNGDHDLYSMSGWNLNNISNLEGSLLKYVKEPITGINVPWLYLGMLFSTFCWHTEDNYFSSINYMHFGKDKVWYGIPSSHSRQFEKVKNKHSFACVFKNLRPPKTSSCSLLK